MKRRLALGILSGVILVLVLMPLTSCTSTPSEARLQGAGSTFANPIYQKWFSLYMPDHANVKLDYQSIGSGGGIKAIQGQTVDFAGTDAPLTDDQIKQSPSEMLHIPTVMGGVVMTYNIPSIGSTVLKFSGDVIAGMYLGTIKKWNDPKITADNPGVTLPDADIATVHRSDGSGTTYCFADYLSKVSPEWSSKVGKGTSVNWPGGIGSKGSEGVTGSVKQTPNSIGYVELIYAMQNNLSYADVKNADGVFVKASLDSVTAAAASAASNMPSDLRVSITNAPGKDAYPISTFTWILVYKDQKDQAKGEALAKFLWWGIHDGQKAASGIGYAPLPGQVVQKDEEKIKAMMNNGKAVYTAMATM
ncbi:MAG: phosphate ABC transporter substrate-binding protein PstS [Blastocatellia bacterium]